MKSNPHIEELQNYIKNNYDGNIELSLESIGGLRLIRKILGLKDFAVLDARLYHLEKNLE